MISNTEFKAIAELDLDPIKVKLMHEESGEGWTLAYAGLVEAEYRRFLYLMKMFPNEPTAPLFDVDIFWHYHILDTMKYVVDCESVFGYFLHHFPYVGLRGEEDEVAHQSAGQRMKELYEATFGEAYGQALQAATQAQASRGLDAVPAAWPVKAAGQLPMPPAAAWSVRVPDGTLTAGARTAWSVKVPAEKAGDGMRAAWSVRVAKDAESKAGKSAWSVRVPATTAGGAFRPAWSVKVAQEVAAANAGQTAWSVRAPAASMVGDGFYTRRPVLTTT
jgi:hypothetical protein